MTWWHWLLITAGATAALYAAFIVWLLLAGRRGDARALAGFIPDCIVLFAACSLTIASPAEASCCWAP